MGKNYKNELLSIDKEYSDSHCLKLNEIYDSITVNLASNLTKSLDTLKGIYDVYDNAVEPIKINSSCKRGCNTCCNLVVEMTLIEAKAIRDYLVKNFSDSFINELDNKLREEAYYCPSISELNGSLDSRSECYKSRLEYYKLNRPCAFLNDEGECCIYEVRPISCRTYLVFSDPTFCKPSENNKPSEYGSTINELAQDAVYHLDAAFLGNGYLVVNTLPHRFKNGILNT